MLVLSFAVYSSRRNPAIYDKGAGAVAPLPLPHSCTIPRVIQVANFHKSYKTTVAVEDLSFEVLPGQVLGLLGPNGAGKTTTMRAIAGIIPPTRGRLFVGGVDVQLDPVNAKRRLAYVPDDPKLFDALTVWEHLRFVAATYRAAAIPRTDSFIVRIPFGSRPVSGSSNRIAAGRCKYAQQIATFCRIPRDNSPAIAFRFSVSSN